LGIGDWGLGIGDWGLGIGPNPQSPLSIEIIRIINKYINYKDFISQILYIYTILEK